MSGKLTLYLLTKRAIDILGSLVGLLLTVILFIPIAIAIKVNSSGPVFFKQVRLTKGGLPFLFYKYRTMRIGYNLTAAERDRINEMGGPHFKSRLDPRITSVGRILRMFSLDELPQFWNVLKGDMSLVGPRPPLSHEYKKYSKREKSRLSTKAGITGLWQISGRSTTTFEEMVELDIKYIDKCSLFLDVYIIIATLPTVILRKGAW